MAMVITLSIRLGMSLVSKEQHISMLGFVLHSISQTLNCLSMRKSSPKS